MAARPEWQDLYIHVYRVALDLGDPGGDAVLADLQQEARLRLPLADLATGSLSPRRLPARQR